MGHLWSLLPAVVWWLLLWGRDELLLLIWVRDDIARAAAWPPWRLMDSSYDSYGAGGRNKDVGARVQALQDHTNILGTGARRKPAMTSGVSKEPGASDIMKKAQRTSGVLTPIDTRSKRHKRTNWKCTQRCCCKWGLVLWGVFPVSLGPRNLWSKPRNDTSGMTSALPNPSWTIEQDTIYVCMVPD